MDLAALVSSLDGYRGTPAVPDAPHALNGLQVSNSGTVRRVAAAVDVCAATVRLAAEQGADLLLVHHGLFWGGLLPLTDRLYKRVAGLIGHDIALYSAHLPLDLHPEVGNNALLARALGVLVRGVFGEAYGVPIGVWGEVDLARAALEERLAALCGRAPRLMAGGPGRVRPGGLLGGAPGSETAPAGARGPPALIHRPPARRHVLRA